MRAIAIAATDPITGGINPDKKTVVGLRLQISCDVKALSFS
jgi:hypothetical protein